MMSESPNNDNIIFTPEYIKLDKEAIDQNTQNQKNSLVNQSSLLTYSKIVCCICGISMNANSTGICDACEKKNVDITSGITKESTITYCRTCERYKRPPWIKCTRESSDMMDLCLSKIKGLNKVQVIDSSFIWTEPHSKEIKIKLSIQKEINKSLFSTSFIVLFKEEWTQCEDCKKTFTPHTWKAVVQIRQKVNHKRTFLYLEQIILKHKAQTKALSIKEHPEGVDFYFANKAQANSFASFIREFLPCQTKLSRQLISVDDKSNEAVYKETLKLEIAPVCQDDLIVLNEEEYKKLGSIGPVLLCYKQLKNLQFIDPITFEIIELDNNTYWRYGLKSYIDRKCLSEFLILSCEEEIDYKSLSDKNSQSTSKRQYKKIKRSNNNNNQESMEVEENKLNTTNSTVKTNITNKSLYNQQLDKKLDEKKMKIVNVKCVRNNEKDDKDIIEIRSCLGRKMRPGDIFYGYDLTRINLREDLEGILAKKAEKIPDIVLVKKKYNNYKKIFKLKHLDMDVDDEEDDEEEKETKKKGKGKGKKKNKNKKDKDMEEFMEDVGKNKDLRKNINLYKDTKAIEELEKQVNNMGIDEKDLNDSDVDIKVDELLNDIDDLTLENNGKEDDDINTNSNQLKDENESGNLGKRERNGKEVKEE